MVRRKPVAPDYRRALAALFALVNLTSDPGVHPVAASGPDVLLSGGSDAALRQSAPAQPVEFHLAFSKAVADRPFTGRVFVVASKQPIKNGPHRQSWFKPEPFFAQDLAKWEPGAPLVFRPQLQFPQPLAQLAEGKYYVQAIMDRDLGGQSALAAPGNAFSEAVAVEVHPRMSGPIELAIDQVVAERKFVETDRVKLVDIGSPLLTAFHRWPVRLRAGVVLPKSYAGQPERRYPVVYEIPGFGGDYHMAFLVAGRKLPDVGVEMIHVVLDPACRLGHHVFADSANNGPYGKALVRELIPYIEASYRAVGKPRARFVTGHSSGGWSSLWLQVTYPDFFGGVWSTAPDPVDFRDFQKVDIYASKANIFRDQEGQDRPIARRGGKPVIFYKPFSDMEVVLGRGGQLFSFEAVFSPKGPDGRPLPLWDRVTGAIDPKVAETWQRYDIRMILEKNWPTLGPKLAGKLHVYMGAEDTFYLEGATILLQKTLKDLGSNAVVEIFPGRDHGTLMDQKMRDRITREMAEAVMRQGT
jgi:hypothetical protein